MGRWSHLDTDEERLPEGMTRVGYDADTQIYTYRDSDGSYWEGAPGVRYGKLHRVQSEAPPLPSVTTQTDSEGDYDDYYHDSDSDGLPPYPDEKTNNFSEKDNDPGLARPNKAKIRRNALPAGSPVDKTLPSPDDDADMHSLSGTTVRESICTTTTATSSSDITRPEKSQSGTGLKRSGTLSRLTRFLSSSSSPRRDPAGLRRAATVGGRSSASGAADLHRQGRLSRAASTVSGETVVTDRDRDRWPRPRPGTDNLPRKRATTFDEILGRM
ncbi:hypothetical protein C8A03DRAFT_39462 [Achaetomium macrosporum]|uniref:Carbohydrate-binding module family 50 protein n=1 Tax=Achaetomium macrosporum TaxID=79813 RepID=A0AAN7C058_9PEZI|nr:hypothetical protein C8A03DRAFT_39462 [Achaetomium macrosporum]